MIKKVTLSVIIFMMTFSACSSEKKELLNLSKNEKSVENSDDTIEEMIEDFLEDKFVNNSKIIDVDIKVTDRNELQQMKGWYSFIVDVNATVKTRKKNQTRNVEQRMIYFSNGVLVTPEIFDIKTGDQLKDLVAPQFKKEYYKKENLIYGNANAKYRVAIFSDPLCPFCRSFVPEAIKFMKKDPKKFAIYYYHFPLKRLHPAAMVLTRAAIVAELQGNKDVILNLYKLSINAREKDEVKILNKFNEVMNTKITSQEINDVNVLKLFNADMNLANKLMVGGTPTIFFNDKIDRTKIKYKKAN